MLNIISRSILFKNVSGPKKVVENLIKGLDILGYPYVINKGLDSCQRLWIHDDTIALKKVAPLPPEIKVVAGPNLYNLPKNIPSDLDLKRVVYLQPSPWAKKFWEYFGFNKCVLDVWPTGIDTEKFKPFNEKKEFVLVYFKFRLESELKGAKKILEKRGLNYKIIEYGKYKNMDYQNLLRKTRYIIWLGITESQGIALAEALSADIPILIWDVKYMGQSVSRIISNFTKEEKDYQNTTSAPYFDDSCGVKIKEASELEKAVEYMEKNLNKFQPRKYILENLSLDKKAKDLIFLYEKHFGLKYKDGFNEKLLKRGDWLNNKFYYIIYLKLKHFVKMLLIKSGIWNFMKL